MSVGFIFGLKIKTIIMAIQKKDKKGLCMTCNHCKQYNFDDVQHVQIKLEHGEPQSYAAMIGANCNYLGFWISNVVECEAFEKIKPLKDIQAELISKLDKLIDEKLDSREKAKLKKAIEDSHKQPLTFSKADSGISEEFVLKLMAVSKVDIKAEDLFKK